MFLITYRITHYRPRENPIIIVNPKPEEHDGEYRRGRYASNRSGRMSDEKRRLEGDLVRR